MVVTKKLSPARKNGYKRRPKDILRTITKPKCRYDYNTLYLFTFMFTVNDIIIGFSTISNTRYQATSGGVGSSILYYLFQTKRISSALAFRFNPQTLHYAPHIITSPKEYTPSGSIYHDINTVAFLKENLKHIKGSFACFTLPCQTSIIKNILSKNGIEHYIIELTCSSQQSFEATEYLLKRQHIPSSDVDKLQYRGNGWPSGINIRLKNGENISLPNNTSLWTRIFHSHLFIMPRCFSCPASRPLHADIQLADPWGIDSPHTETQGRTLCRIGSKKMANLLQEMSAKGVIFAEKRDEADYIRSQFGTIMRKTYNLKHRKITLWTKSMLTNKTYRTALLEHPWLFEIHFNTYTLIQKVLHKIERIMNL